MTSEQLRVALAARNPRRWTKKKLAGMTESGLRAAMRTRRAKGFRKSDICGMSAVQLRSALASVCPGVYSEEKLEALDEDELRRQLRQRTRANLCYFEKSDIAGMDSEQLRMALHFEAAGLLSDAEIAGMDLETLRAQQALHRRLGYTAQVTHS